MALARLRTWPLCQSRTDAASVRYRRKANIAAMALANKTARVAWAMLNKGTDYQLQAA